MPCPSCPTVTQGDICFNCGRLGALLLTPAEPPHPPTTIPAAAITRPSNLSLHLRQSNRKARAVLKAKKLLSQSQEQQATDMSAQSSAFDDQFAEIEQLSHAIASSKSPESECSNAHELCSGQMPLEPYVPFSRQDIIGLHYLGRNLMGEIDQTENTDVDESLMPSLTIVECDACGALAHDITMCPLSPFDDRHAVPDVDANDSVSNMFETLSFTDTIVSREVVVESPAELEAGGKSSASSVDAFTLDRQLGDIYECERGEYQASWAVLSAGGVECRFVDQEGYAFEWSILL